MAEESRTFKLTALQERQLRNQSAGEEWSGYATTLLGKRAMIPQSAGVDAFTAYITGTQGRDLVDDSSIMCLADALMYWLVRGDATSVCPSYEFYLQVVIQIITYWSDGTMHMLDADFDGGGFCREPPARWEYEKGDSYAIDGDCVFVVLPPLVRLDSTTRIWNHPALSKDTFEYVRFRREAGHADEFALA